MSKTAIDEEFQSLQLDKPSAGKTAQQILKHSLDTQYDNKPIERSLYILSKGDDLQKLSVIQSLPNLLDIDNNGTVSRIIPKIQQELPINTSTEFQLVTSKMFKVLIDMKLDLNLLRAVFLGIENKDPVVASSWTETLLEVIHSLTDNVVKTEYKKDVVPLTQSLCQDCQHEVRAAMCVELPNVAEGLGNSENVKTCLLPCLVELSSDENMQVRAAAVDAAALLIPCLSPDIIKLTAIPLVKRLCNQCRKEGDQTFPSVAKIYGKLLTNLQIHLTELDCVWFLDTYKELSRTGLSISNEDLETDSALALICRESCAANLPTITFFTFTQIPQEMPKWYSIFKDLAGDPCYLVRKTVANCIHEIVKVLGKDAKIVLPDFLKLIRDEAEEVLDSLVSNIGPTLLILTASGVLSKEQSSQATLDIGRALLKCQTEIFKYYNWRRRKIFLEQLETLPLCMPPDFIHQHFSPLIMKMTIDARARPVRTQAARTLLIFLRYNAKENHRKWIRETLISTLCNSNSCYTRHIFINMCIEAIDIFSWKYFKEHFFLPLLTLGDDPVSTVRLCVIQMCPTLKKMLVMPIDRSLQMKLENLISKMEMMEKDRDVLATLKLKLKEMRSQPINKQEALVEEKRKVDEEDRIMQGKILGGAGRNPAPLLAKNIARDPSRRVISQPSRGTISSSTSLNEMSFLDQHFYIDAGVALPESASNTSLQVPEDNLSRLDVGPPCGSSEEMVSTVSVENTNIENMSDEDLIELKTSTTNITDDVKVNIEKKASASKLRTFGEGVTKRNKRSSCFFASDISQIDKKLHLNRRSLNIATCEISRIPVISKTFPLKASLPKIKAVTEQNNIKTILGASKLKKPTLKTDTSDKNLDRDKDNINVCNKGRNKSISLDNRGVKENMTINNSITDITLRFNKEFNVSKSSNLPVLIRRPSGQQ